jgi:hypothetical protein
MRIPWPLIQTPGMCIFRFANVNGRPMLRELSLTTAAGDDDD